MKKQATSIKADTIIKVNNLTAAARYMEMAKENGATEIMDNETRQKGGRKYDLDGEIIYIYMA